MTHAPTNTRHWLSVLSDEQAIAQYIDENSSAHVSAEEIEEYFSGCGAILKLVPISELTEGNPDGNVASARKQKKYDKLPLETMPPIVVENGEVMDGNHRYRSAMKAGAQSMWCYVVVDSAELEQHLTPVHASLSSSGTGPTL